MGLEQLHRTAGVHFRGNDRTKVVLQIDGVDGGLGAIRIVANFQRTGKLLVFMAVPMKTDTDTDILQNECLFPLLKLNMRRR